MNDLFAKRLKRARTMSNLSQDELVRKMHNRVSKNAISKYEKGIMMPSSEVLLAICNALNLKLDYFFKEDNVSIDNVEFRKASKLGKKQLDSINEIVIDQVSNYLDLELALDIQSEFHNPLSDILIKTSEDVEFAAQKLAEHWNLGMNAFPNVIDLLEDKEVKVIEIDAPAEFDGFSGFANGKYPVIVINNTFNVERLRLTALHELGHLLLKFDQGIEHKQIEKMCFQFSGALLIPRPTFLREFGGIRKHISISELVAIKESYGISVQAIMARAYTLGLITERNFIEFRKWITNNRMEKGLGNYIGEENSKRYNQLVYRAVTQEVISMSKAASLSNMSLTQFRKAFIAI